MYKLPLIVEVVEGIEGRRHACRFSHGFLGVLSMKQRRMKVERNGDAMSFLGSVDKPNFLIKKIIAVIHVYLQFWFYQLV